MATLLKNCHVKGEVCYRDYNRVKFLKLCSLCNSSDHQAKCCPKMKCYFCGRFGHSQKLCWFKQTNKSVNLKRAYQRMKMEELIQSPAKGEKIIKPPQPKKTPVFYIQSQQEEVSYAPSSSSFNEDLSKNSFCISYMVQKDDATQVFQRNYDYELDDTIYPKEEIKDMKEKMNNFINYNFQGINDYYKIKAGVEYNIRGLGDWGLGPIPNPQSPIPNPQKSELKVHF